VAIAFVSVVSVVSACANSWDMPNARIRPESLDASVPAETWTAAVVGAAQEWNDALVAFDCPAPFDLEPANVGAHPVRLVPVEAWQYGEGSDGITFGDWPTQPDGCIEIRADAGGSDGKPDGWRSALLHEMGHAIGLGHQDRATPTVMCESSSCSAAHLTMSDIAGAADALGCLME
jgi:hypothetical protein